MSLIVKRGFLDGACSNVEPVQEHFHPPRFRHYLARVSFVHYAVRPGQEGDVERR
jgi:hypothetical protein